MRKGLFYIFWLLIFSLLLLISLNYKDRSKSMVAQVESQETAISYQKSVRIKKLHVVPGQIIKPGDVLVEVERFNFLLDFEKKTTESKQIHVRLDGISEKFYQDINLLNVETAEKIRSLESKKAEFALEHQIKREQENQYSALMGEKYKMVSDTFRTVRLEMIDQQIADAMKLNEARRSRIVSNYKQDTLFLNYNKQIINKELEELQREATLLIRIAKSKGTVGNVFVQLNELIPPFKTIMSIYDLKPTLIKAFVNERAATEINIGAEVLVESTNRRYNIIGNIIEIGSRVTAYPDKINPVNQKFYGQEVFVRIPEENNFLNGEKVYVYITNEYK